MKYLFTAFCLSFLTLSCSVTESIVFNENMGGVFKSTFDMSQILAITKEGGFQTENENLSKVVDTTIVFNDFLETMKDSINALPTEKQKQLRAMKDVVIDLKVDDKKSVFNFTVHKPFANFEELKQINEQLDGAMNIAQTLSGNAPDDAEEPSKMHDLTKSNMVIYGFSQNTFSRHQSKETESVDAIITEDETESITDAFRGQFDDLFKATFYTMTYTFPKAIKSVSSNAAVVSDDGKTMTLQTDVNAINKTSELMHLEVVLED